MTGYYVATIIGAGASVALIVQPLFARLRKIEQAIVRIETKIWGNGGQKYV